MIPESVAGRNERQQNWHYALFRRTLFEGSHAQHIHFLLCEEAPVAAAEVLLGESSKLYAVEFHHTVAEVLEDAAHDAVLAAVNLDAYLALVGVTGILDGVGMYFAVLKFDAVGNLLQVVCCHVLVEIYMVNLLLEELGVCELRGEVAVVGEEKHAGGVAVESAYGVDALRTYVLDEVHYGLALLWVIACGDAILRLVEQDINLLLKGYGLVVELYFVGAHYLCSEFCYSFAVHCHHSCLYEFIGFATAAYACVGEELVETDGFVRVEVLLFIFYALFQAVFCIGIVAGGMLTLIALLVAAVVVVASLTLVASAVESSLAWLIALLTLLVASLLSVGIVLARLVTLLARLVTSLLSVVVVTWAVASLLAWLVAVLLSVVVVTWAVASLLTLLVASLLSVVVVAWAVASLLTLLVASLLSVVVVARAVSSLLTLLVAAVAVRLQSCAESFGAEAAFVVACVGAVGIKCALGVDTRTLRASCHAAVFSLITPCGTAIALAFACSLIR